LLCGGGLRVGAQWNPGARLDALGAGSSSVRPSGRQHLSTAPRIRLSLGLVQIGGRVAEWLMAADCKSAREGVHWFESSPFHHLKLFEKLQIFGFLLTSKSANFFSPSHVILAGKSADSI